MSDEAIGSSVGIFHKGQHGGMKGLQQFFTPDKAAGLVHDIIGDVNVIDLTAGDGSLLKHFQSQYCYGVEIDKDQIKNAEGSYQAVHGDLQHVYTLLRMGAPEFDGIVLNPPFGLPWEEPSIRGGRPTNSATMAFIMASRLLSENGQIALICGKGQFDKYISVLPEAAGIYAVIDVDQMFPNVRLDCVIAFAVHPGNRGQQMNSFLRRSATMDTLDLMAPWVKETRETALGYNHVATYRYGSEEFKRAIEAINVESRRRSEKRLASDREFDMWLDEKGKVKFLPSGYAQVAIRKANDHNAFSGLNEQSANYFAQNELLWEKIEMYAASGIITVEPKFLKMVSSLRDVYYAKLVPNYQITKAQRIAFIKNGGYIKCIKDDPERGFVKGETYPTRMKIDAAPSKTVTRVEPSKKTPGEWVTNVYAVSQQQLHVTIGSWRFSDSGADSSEDMDHCITHFQMPDPGHLEEKYPDEINKLELQCQTILDEYAENSLVWEAKAKNKGAMPYSHRPFQRKDIAKILFKGKGMLSWEQGLGKTLGGLLFHDTAVRFHGAQDAQLVVTAKDLIPQWEREIERFTGKKPIVIRSHGQAHAIAKHLKRGGTGLYITYYEALTLVGTRGKQQLLPHVVVRIKEERKRVKWTGRWGYFHYQLPDGTATLEKYHEEPVLNAETGEREFTVVHNDETGADDLVATTQQVFNKIVPFGKDDGQTAEIDGELKRLLYAYIPEQYEKVEKHITSKELCPECEADLRSGWNGIYCEAEDDKGKKCGYAHYAVRVKPIASLLSTAFSRGTIVLDEIQMIQGNFSKRSTAIRGLNAKHKLGMTGTPIKNFIGQAFWLLWWCLGDGSQDGARFPYTYDGGYGKFETDYSVIEYKLDKQGRKVSRQVRPEISNVLMLWRQLCSSIIRRRKEDTGEDLVPKFYHEIHVPLGIVQTEQINSWLKNFPAFFAEKYPDAPVVKAGMHEIMAPMLGLNWKLEYGCTLPKADPDGAWTGIEGLSNFTPGTLKVLELSMALVKEGRKVLVGSNLVPTSEFIASALVEKGVNAVHILDDQGQTTTAEKRADIVYKFQSNTAQVLCAGIKAIRLGHNLDAADAVILHGFDWSYDDMDQFVARVHRLTSKNPIDIYVILPTLPNQPTITSKKWARLTAKGQAADLALDGRLIQKHEQEISEAEEIRDLMARGMTVTDDAVDEVDVYETWERLDVLENYEAPEGLLPTRPDIVAIGGVDEVVCWVATKEEAEAELADAENHDAQQEAVVEEIEEVYEDDESIGELPDFVSTATCEADLDSDELAAWESYSAQLTARLAAPPVLTTEEVLVGEDTYIIEEAQHVEDENQPAEDEVPILTNATVESEGGNQEAGQDEGSTSVGVPVARLNITDEIRALKALLDEDLIDLGEFKAFKAALITKVTA